MTTTDIRREAARKAHETRRANKAAQLAATVGPVPQIAGFHAYICPSCKRVEHVIAATATVWHRCPSAGLKQTTYIKVAGNEDP